MCATLVYINIVIMSTWKGVEWSVWLYNYGDDIVCQPIFWLDLLVLFSWNLSYSALYDLNYILHNPFGGRRIDVAHNVIGRGIRNLSRSLTAQGGAHLPPGIAPVTKANV